MNNKSSNQTMIALMTLFMLFANDVEAGNTPPTANAGSDEIVDTLNTVTLNGLASEPNDPGLNLTYAWQQVAGITVVLSANDVVQPEFEAPKLMPGAPSIQLAFSLVVNDGFEDSAPDTVIITVDSYPAMETVFNAVVINRFIDPSDSRETLGDLLFTPDGSQAQLLVGSKSFDSRVLIADVFRDANHDVTGFGAWSELFAVDLLDTGLTYGPGSDTFFYHIENAGIGQRTALGAEEVYLIQNYNSEFGGFAFIPSIYSNGGQILKSEYEEGRMFLHAVLDDGDDTFTISPGTLNTQLPFAESGDIEYITTGLLADHIVVAGYGLLNESVYLIPVDGLTGLPVLNPNYQVLASGND